MYVQIVGEKVLKFEDSGLSNLIGEIKDGVFLTERNAEKHLHFKYDAWGLDASIIEELITRKI